MISSLLEGLMLAAVILALAFIEYQKRRSRRQADRMSSLRNQLEKMRQELADLQRDRLELLSTLSSTMEEPLEEILDEVEAMARPGERDPSGIERGLSRLRRAASEIARRRETLEEIDLLRASALQDGGEGASAEMPEEWNDRIALDDLLTEAIQSCAEDLSGKRLNLTVAMDEDLMIRGSRDYILKALSGILSRTVALAPVDSIVSVTLEAKPPLAELRITFRGQPHGASNRIELAEELARQVLTAHGGWLRHGKKQGEYQAGLPLD